MVQLLSVQTGRPRTIVADGDSDPWVSGIQKQPISGRVWLHQLNLVGDGQADTKHHGGVDKAVLGYAEHHYAAWMGELGLTLPYGAFGENFTIRGQDETSVCIGDLYQIGGVLVEVSQPRQPCWKLSRRWQIPDLETRVLQSGRTGWYFRVKRQGWIRAGDNVVLLERPAPEWTVVKVSQMMNSKSSPTHMVRNLATCQWLSNDWRMVFQKRLLDTEVSS